MQIRSRLWLLLKHILFFIAAAPLVLQVVLPLLSTFTNSEALNQNAGMLEGIRQGLDDVKDASSPNMCNSKQQCPSKIC